MENSFALTGNEASHDLLGHILSTIAQEVLQLLGVELLDHLLLALHNLRVLLRELVQSTLVFEKHLEKPSSSLEHLIETVF